MVEGFECPYDPRNYVVRGTLPLVGSPQANSSKVKGQTKQDSRPLMMFGKKDLCTLAGGILGPCSGTVVGGRAHKQVSGGWPFANGVQLDTAKGETLVHPPVGPPSKGRAKGVRCYVAFKDGGLCGLIPRY